MDTSPNRTIGIVQNLRAGRAQNQAPVNPHPLRRDHNQIGVIRRGASDNPLWLAMLHEPLYTIVFQPSSKKPVEMLHLRFT